MKQNKSLLEINDLIQKYPFFTRYNINKAINERGLPYLKIGNKKMFDEEKVEKWIDKELKTKKRDYDF